MTIVCNIWMICLELNWFVYDPSWMLHLSEFVWALRSSVWVVFNNFLLLDATDRSKISSDQKRFFIPLSLYPISFLANTPFKKICNFIHVYLCSSICLYISIFFFVLLRLTVKLRRANSQLLSWWVTWTRFSYFIN